VSPYTLLTDVPINQQRVLVRVDFNVPIINNCIADDYRLKAFIPTLSYLQQQYAQIILITHLGKPKGFDPALSTRILIPWFVKQGYELLFASDINQAYELSRLPENRLILVENLRFFPGEKERDQTFAQDLARLGEFYVNDAFGALHRSDSSLTLTPLCFPPDKRCIGLLVEKELTKLNRILQPTPPFIVIVGGGKLQTKIPLLKAMIGKADIILICPAIAFTFLAAQNYAVGSSLVDNTLFDTCIEIITTAAYSKTRIVFPVDYFVSTNGLQPPYTVISADSFKPQDCGVGIGPQTVAQWNDIVAHGKTIFFNGLMGDVSVPDSTRSSVALFSILAHVNAYTVIAGGDSVACAIAQGFEHNISYLSTGGGATLAYLAGQELPGLVVLKTT
jgi:phosphoglycerate kinase